MNNRILSNTSKGAALGAGAGFFLDLFQQISSISSNGHGLNWENFKSQYDLYQAVQSTLKLSCAGAAIGLSYSLLTNFSANTENERFNQNEFLTNLLANSKVDLNSKHSKVDRKIISKVVDFLERTYGSQMADRPIPAGSLVKRTALYSLSDYDIALVMLPNSGTLSYIHESFYETLSNEFQSYYCNVRRQRRSIGLIFQKLDGSDLKIDILPAKARGEYYQTGDLTLWDRGLESTIKTNIKKQNALVIGQPQARQSIKLLKLYKESSEILLSTPLINHLVTIGLQKRGGYSSVAGNLRYSMEYIAKKLGNKVIPDPCNGNNDLFCNMTPRQKSIARDRLLYDLDSWNLNSHHLKNMFANVFPF
jgi:hypothetical protein